LPHARLPHRLQHDAWVFVDDGQQHEGRTHGPPIPALPMAERRDRKAEPSRELPLREPQARSQAPDVEGHGPPIVGESGPKSPVCIRLIRWIAELIQRITLRIHWIRRMQIAFS
jgi:hypothetical protein